MFTLYDFIVKRCNFYEKKYPGKYQDWESVASMRGILGQLEKTPNLAQISQFFECEKPEAIDQTPFVSCDRLINVKSCSDEKHDHKNDPCGMTDNIVSATLFVSEKTKNKLLYIELFNSRVYNYRALFVLCQPNLTPPIYYSLWAYRVHNAGKKATMDDIAHQYIFDFFEQESRIPERFYFPKMLSFLEEHQLTSIQHNCDANWEKSLCQY